MNKEQSVEKMSKELLVKKCLYYAKQASEEVQNWDKEPKTRWRIIHMLGAVYYVGKYNAYLEVLYKVDVDKELYDAVREETKEAITNIYMQAVLLMQKRV